jgi:hypothetical protein
MKVNFFTGGRKVHVTFGIDQLSPREQADLCIELLEITGATAVMVKHVRGSGEYQSVVDDIRSAIMTHWEKKV